MKIKLDENIGNRGVEILSAAGHDVATVVEQTLCSASDQILLDVCSAESRCLVTLDLGFSNPILFNPSQHAGIAVLRLPKKATQIDLLTALVNLVKAFERDSIQGKLWIVERHRIRVYRPDETSL